MEIVIITSSGRAAVYNTIASGAAAIRQELETSVSFLGVDIQYAAPVLILRDGVAMFIQLTKAQYLSQVQA